MTADSLQSPLTKGRTSLAQEGREVEVEGQRARGKMFHLLAPSCMDYSSLMTFPQWSDAHRLLSFYQEWLDDLFPKAKFIDALAMVEKAGHNKTLRNLRVDWINEGRPKATVVEDGGDAEPDTEQQDAPKQAERVVPTFEASGRPRTPELDDLFGGDNIYNATPQAETRKSDGGEPDEDELDALMAMEDAGDAPAKTSSGGYQSIFGDGKPKAPEPPPADDDDDDLDALMAEAEAEKTSDQKVVPAAPKTRADDEDDLDALMAEEEAHTAAEERTIPVGSKAASKEKMPDFDDEEEAMAEMDELW